jgi:hypothetical protein
VHNAGYTLRESTTRWFAEHVGRLALDASLATVLQRYRGEEAAPNATSIVTNDDR